jgi:hypothetical protein
VIESCLSAIGAPAIVVGFLAIALLIPKGLAGAEDRCGAASAQIIFTDEDDKKNLSACLIVKESAD